AGKLGRRLAIECKVTAETRKYFPKDEIQQLIYFAQHFGAEPFVAVKFPQTKWHFFSIEDLKETNNGYSIKQEDCELKGILIENLVN
ncbi:MAG: Holliday junction resolvase Hjc, partial [Candidatus Woesearchaeota archaeon]